MLSSKLGFILYSVVALLIQVPNPQTPIPGTYFITNSYLSPVDDTGRLAATFEDGQGDVTDVTVTPLNGSEVQRVWLDSLSHILFSISLDFVVDHLRRRLIWRASYHACYRPVRCSGSNE